ncbi:monovalent cation/H(+) antiporter subunit G [Actinomadura sp. NTSP31]|uniref:monovalent cation/H(+) antiporter subunit G n=1 Tax=Actinomadura sp. NTSP31 TaxID=1735447 RepID=UPI0035C01BE8
MTTAFTAAFLLLGAGASLSAGLGLLRLPDLFTRMHAATKSQAVGLLLVLVGVGIRFPTIEVLTSLVLVALLQIMTVPVAAHLVGRAAYRTGRVDRDLLHVDELERALESSGDDPPGTD